MDYTLSQRKKGKILFPKAHLIVVSEPSSSRLSREESLAADCPPAIPLWGTIEVSLPHWLLPSGGRYPNLLRLIQLPGGRGTMRF